MARKKTMKKSQDFAAPLSILLFKEDAVSLSKISNECGLPRSVLIRLAVHSAIKEKKFKGMAAS